MTRLPTEGELVLCTITNIQKNCAWARLDEYDIEGMIHISEVASSWVRNIRNFIRDDQHLVCRVMNVDPKTNHVGLSIKRVSDAEVRQKMESARRVKRAEKLLEFAAKQMGVDPKTAYETVGKKLEDEFGDVYSALEAAARGEKLPVEKKWAEVLTEIGKKNIIIPTYKITRFMTITSEKPDGLLAVKKAIKTMMDQKVHVQYISAPKYMVTLQGEDRKQVANKLQKIGDEAIKLIESMGGVGELLK